MSTSTYTVLMNISQQIVTYIGITNVVLGILGNLLNIIVFLSLKTFRQSSCAFYLTVMSFVNIGLLIMGQLSRVMITGFNTDWTSTSLFYCKFRWYSIEVCAYISFTCMCLATIDQFLATCVHVYWQQWSNIRLAHRLSAATSVFWILYGIPYFVFYNNIALPTTGKDSCGSSNVNFRQYHVYMNTIILSGGLPILITVIFGSLAFRNIRRIAYRTVPLVRRELDKQLTNMVLVQVVFSFFAVLPYVVSTVFPLVTNLNSTRLSAITLILACFYYFYFAYPFYIYICVSGRFRQQLIYVLFKLHLNRWRRRRIATNQILPEPHT